MFASGNGNIPTAAVAGGLAVVACKTIGDGEDCLKKAGMVAGASLGSSVITGMTRMNGDLAQAVVAGGAYALIAKQFEDYDRGEGYTKDFLTGAGAHFISRKIVTKMSSGGGLSYGNISITDDTGADHVSHFIG